MTDILVLHASATRRGRIGYTARKARWDALELAARALCSRLPFKHHFLAMDNPTQNHTGYTNGRDHIVLDEDFSAGRLHRTKGAALCGGDSANLWGDADSVTCKRCLTVAQRLATKEGN